MIGFKSKLSGASGRAMAAYVSPSARYASTFSAPNTHNGSLNTLFASMLVKLAGGRAGSGPVALVHVIRQTQAGMSRCRIFFEPLDFARPPLKRFGREWSANESTRRRVEAGDIHFVKVNGAVAAESRVAYCRVDRLMPKIVLDCPGVLSPELSSQLAWGKSATAINLVPPETP